MKKYKFIYSTLLALTILINVNAQDVQSNISEAKSAYSSGNLDDARFALEKALQEIDVLIGKEILKLLPNTLDNLNYKSDDDDITGTASNITGLYVNRRYANSEGDKSITFNIITDSPLMSSIGAILTMPLIIGADPNQKKIKVGGYKSLLQKTENENAPSKYDVQVPFGSSLLTLNFVGYISEDAVISLSNQIPVASIVEITK